MSADSALPARLIAPLLGALEAMSLADFPAVVAAGRLQLADFLRRLDDGLLMCGLISAFNDAVTRRLLTLTAEVHRLPPVPWSWLAFGSEGRGEQTWATDQDNGLVFLAADAHEAAALRQLFLPFAEAVNQHLATAGIALCPGRIMAGNPACCLSSDEWRWRFLEWVRRPDPEALLNAAIFFDLRVLYGDEALLLDWQGDVLAAVKDTPALLHLLAANAVQAEPPLGFRGDCLPDKQGLLDLKKFGSRIFVDSARIFALSQGLAEAGTVPRLHLLGPQVGLSASEVPALVAAFAHLQRLRVRHQLAGSGCANALSWSSLHDMDKAILREALLQAKRVQQRLKLNFFLQ